MPTVLYINGWRFFFYANENNEPVHIHANKGDANCKFWLLVDVYDIKVAYIRRMSPVEVRAVRKIIFDHFDLIVDAWREFDKRKDKS